MTSPRRPILACLETRRILAGIKEILVQIDYGLERAVIHKMVLAGGGHRSWWQLGWFEAVTSRVPLALSEIAAVSAGAATACFLYTNRASAALAYYEEVLGADAKNAYWANWRAGRAAVFPHERIYRNALRALIGKQGFAELKRNAPIIRVSLARPPAGLPVSAALGVGLLAYKLEKYLFKPLHPRIGRRIGFRTEVATVQSCEGLDELIDLILASSCTPPFTAIQYRDGRPCLDGGVVDNVPVDALSSRIDDSLGAASASTLVLVTRRYPRYDTVFRVGSRIYVQPSEKVPASGWDYTAPHDYRATYEQGRADAEIFLRWSEINERLA